MSNRRRCRKVSLDNELSTLTSMVREQGKSYEAEERCKLVARRMIRGGQRSDAQTLLIEGAKLLVDVAQKSEEANDVMLFYVDTLEARDGLVGQHVATVLGRVLPLYRKHGVDPVRVLDALLDFTKNACAVAFEVSGSSDSPSSFATNESGNSSSASGAGFSPKFEFEGDRNIHTVLARHYARARDVNKASRHYLRSNRSAEFAGLLVGLLRSMGAQHADVFVARYVLEYAALGNLADANVLVNACGQAQLGDVYEKSPLTRFARCLLLVLERDAAYPLMATLQQRYSTTLAQHAAIVKPLLATIAKLYYGKSAPKPAGLGGILQSMMSSMMAPPRQ
jgi:Golgi to ER traffic protein 4